MDKSRRGGIRGTSRADRSRRTGQETEVKLRVPDRQALLRRLEELHAIYEGRVHELNTLYDTPDRALMRGGKLLRIRIERPANRSGEPRSSKALNPKGRFEGALLTFKGPVRPTVKRATGTSRYKVREEREVRVADGEALAAILQALGLRPSFRYEKYRSTYRIPSVGDLVLELDEMPMGDFLEAEGSRKAIDRAGKLLGYQPKDYIAKGYGELFRESSRTAGRKGTSKRG